MALVRGRLVAFDSGAHQATVRLDGSATQSIDGIRVAANIATAEMVAGRLVLIDTGESGELPDIVVYAVVA